MTRKQKGKTMGYRPGDGRHDNHDEERDRRKALALQERIAVALEDAAKSWKQIAALMGASTTGPGPAVRLGFEALPPVSE